MQEISYPSSDGKNIIHACVWRPQGLVKGVVQIIHGMCEYVERYTPFAEFLCGEGYVVCGEDHLGHGKSAASAEDLGSFGERADFNEVISDIRALHLRMKEEYPDVNYYILGHSMGSFFCRNYIARYGGELTAAVVMGTGYKSKPVLGFALFAVRLNALFCGWKNRSKLIKNLAFGSYNKRFGGKKNAWLSCDEPNVARYNVDGYCNFDFTDNGYRVLFSVMKAACASKTVKAVPESLPVLFVSGADDPVGGYGKGVSKIYKKFVKAGKNARMILYPGARHEILNEYSAEIGREGGRVVAVTAVRGDILDFFAKNTNG